MAATNSGSSSTATGSALPPSAAAAATGGSGNESSLLASSAANNTVTPAQSQANLSGTSDAVTSSSFIGLSRAEGNGGAGAGASGGQKKTKAEKKFQEEIEQMVTDPSGWQYAFLWPVPEGYVKWKHEPSVHKTFVRRRKKTRAYLKLTDDLRRKLTEFCSIEQKQ